MGDTEREPENTKVATFYFITVAAGLKEGNREEGKKGKRIVLIFLLFLHWGLNTSLLVHLNFD